MTRDSQAFVEAAVPEMLDERVAAPAPTRTAGRGVGIAVGLVAAFAFATSGPMVKPLLLAGWTPGAAILVRLWLGALLLAIPTALALRGRWHVLRDDWRTVVLLGLFGVVGAAALYFLAVDRLPVAVALLVEYTGPLLLLAWSWARTGRTPARATLVGAALAMGGLVLVLDVTGTLDLDPLGLLYASLAAVGNAAYFALTARRIAVPPVALAGSAMVVGAVVTTLLALIGILPVAAPLVDVEVLGTAVPWWAPLLVVGTVPTAFAYGVSAMSVRILGDRLGSFLALTEVLFAVVLAWLLLGEAPLPVQVVGAVLVVAGVALVRAGATTDGEPAAPR